MIKIQISDAEDKETITIETCDEESEEARLTLPDDTLIFNRDELQAFIHALSLVHAQLIDPHKGYKLKLEGDND